MRERRHANFPPLVAKGLMEANGCRACHSYDTKVVGPALNDIAARYKNDKNGLVYLVNKIKNGGNGVWGEVNMPSFATLSEEDRTALASYVLSLADVKKSLPLQGSLRLPPNTQAQKNFADNTDPQNIPTQIFELAVSYTDKGSNPIGPIAVKKSLALAPARFNLNSSIDVKELNKLIEKSRFRSFDTIKLPAVADWLSLPLGRYDLTAVNSVRVGAWVKTYSTAWQVELRAGSAAGVLLAKGVNAGNILDSYSRTELKLLPQTGFHDLFLVVRSSEKSASELQLLDISFHQ